MARKTAARKSVVQAGDLSPTLESYELTPTVNDSESAFPLLVDDSKKSVQHRKQMNRLVKLLRNTRSYQDNRVARPSKLRHVRRSSLETVLSTTSIVADADSAIPSRQASDSSWNLSSTSQTDELGVPDTSRVDSPSSPRPSTAARAVDANVEAKLKTRTRHVFDELKAVHRGCAGDAVPLNTVREAMLGAECQFTLEELHALFGDSKLQRESPESMTYEEFYQMSFYAYFGQTEAELHSVKLQNVSPGDTDA